MARYYPSDFYWSWEGTGKPVNWDEIVKRRQRQLQAKAAWLEDLAPGRLLDIGAQKGEFIWYMGERGWQVEGVEVDPVVPNPAGMPICYGDFLAMDLAASAYDVITLWAVLEHVYRPVAFIEKAAKLLRPGGRIVILVTNLNSIQSRWLLQDDYPRHLTIFTKSSLDRICRRYGMRIVKSSTNQQVFGGALNGGLVYAAKRLGGYSRNDVFCEWKQPRDPFLFWTQWRGRPSKAIRWVSRVDRVLTKPIESMLDRHGFGFILTIAAEKVAHD